MFLRTAFPRSPLTIDHMVTSSAGHMGVAIPTPHTCQHKAGLSNLSSLNFLFLVNGCTCTCGKSRDQRFGLACGSSNGCEESVRVVTAGASE